jgi:hypothetical protein
VRAAYPTGTQQARRPPSAADWRKVPPHRHFAGFCFRKNQKNNWRTFDANWRKRRFHRHCCEADFEALRYSARTRVHHFQKTTEVAR